MILLFHMGYCNICHQAKKVKNILMINTVLQRIITLSKTVKLLNQKILLKRFNCFCINNNLMGFSFRKNVYFLILNNILNIITK